VGSYDPATGTWVVGTLANGASASLSITVLVFALGPVGNTATVSATTPDPDPSNNQDTATVLGMRSAGLLSKTFFLASRFSVGGDPTSALFAELNALMPVMVDLFMNTSNFFEHEMAVLLANVFPPLEGGSAQLPQQLRRFEPQSCP
jgi:hypothetical protein